MNNVLLTGYKGTIGTVAINGLKNYHLVGLGRPEVDISNFTQVKKKFTPCHAVIHCAWNNNNQKPEENTLENERMFFNVYQCARENKIPKIIMASSVHADDLLSWDTKNGFANTEKIPVPSSLYGVSKNFMESMGKYYATQGMEVICIRFGGVNRSNIPPYEAFEREVWLSHSDCVSLLQKCLDTPVQRGRYSCFYAVSNNEGRIHAYTNPFGWIPQDNAQNVKR